MLNGSTSITESILSKLGASSQAKVITNKILKICYNICLLTMKYKY